MKKTDPHRLLRKGFLLVLLLALIAPPGEPTPWGTCGACT